MKDFTIRRVTDPKEGPIDGVSAETEGGIYKVQGERSISGRETHHQAGNNGCRD